MAFRFSGFGRVSGGCSILGLSNHILFRFRDVFRQFLYPWLSRTTPLAQRCSKRALLAQEEPAQLRLVRTRGTTCRLFQFPGSIARSPTKHQSTPESHNPKAHPKCIPILKAVSMRVLEVCAFGHRCMVWQRGSLYRVRPRPLGWQLGADRGASAQAERS